jgi:uncharacterized damage-inducible protein DinB
MSEAKRIADQLRRALRGPAWHGDSVAEILEGVTAKQALAQPIPGAHSIHELVLHMAAWSEIALERVTSGTTRDVPDEENFPAPGDWAVAVERFFNSSDRLAAHIENMSDTELAFVLQPKGQVVYHLLHGIVQHHLYHAGQIMLLKKLV